MEQNNKEKTNESESSGVLSRAFACDTFGMRGKNQHMQSTIVVREDGCVEIPAELLPSITLDESFGTAWTVLATEDAYTLLGVDGVSDFLLGLIAHDEAYVHMSEAAGEWHDYMLFRNGKAIMAMSFAVETHHADGTIEKHDERGYQIALVDEF